MLLLDNVLKWCRAHSTICTAIVTDFLDIGVRYYINFYILFIINNLPISCSAINSLRAIFSPCEKRFNAFGPMAVQSGSYVPFRVFRVFRGQRLWDGGGALKRGWDHAEAVNSNVAHSVP